MEKTYENREVKDSIPSLEEVKRISNEIREEILEIKRVVDGQESCRVNGCNTNE